MSLMPVSQNGSVIVTAQATSSSLLEEEHKSVDSNAITSSTSDNNPHTSNIISEARRESSRLIEEDTIEGLSAELFYPSITTQPTLQQPTLYREYYDSNQFTSGTSTSDEFFVRSIPDSALSATASIFQSTTALPPGSTSWQQPQNTTLYDFYESSQTEQQQAWDNRPTMGYSNMTNGDYAAWGLQGGATNNNNNNNNNNNTASDSKMEASFSPPPQERPSRPERLTMLDTGDDDNTTVRSIDSAHNNVASPTQSPLLGQSISSEHHHHHPHLHHHSLLLLPGRQSTVTTPSTVSTAPCTEDDGSLAGMDYGTLERLALRMDYSAGGEPAAVLYPHHRRVHSWEVSQPQSSHNNNIYASSLVGADVAMSPKLPPAYGGAQQQPPNAWANLHATTTPPQRVASFRRARRSGQPLRLSPNGPKRQSLAAASTTTTTTTTTSSV
jgi:hypothetical protein